MPRARCLQPPSPKGPYPVEPRPPPTRVTCRRHARVIRILCARESVSAFGGAGRSCALRVQHVPRR
eukprot:5115669-Prymnesium_polylepis.1